MRGPYERLKYDLRRVWECPVCQHHERASGRVTWLLCRCQEDVSPGEQRVMKLVDDTIRRILPNPNGSAAVVADEPAPPAEDASTLADEPPTQS